ncbi:tail fiber assembly protein [Candidatus Fukatsuia endosymbiont of Tuberolachnus salignus]|uniref:tail fiber assembly protein n=1 Tax=Candidatus Fukatsuia endosymbiont of Tuberolachnus salignus TaxID=3077957 RepID=UPI003CC7A37A
MTAQQTKTRAEKRRYLLRESMTKIAPLQDAVELGIATENEITELNTWKHYHVALNRLHITTAKMIVCFIFTISY